MCMHLYMYVSIEYPGCWQHLRGDGIACSCIGRLGVLSQRSIASFAGSLQDEMGPHLVNIMSGIAER